jgi:hypothetical protein
VRELLNVESGHNDTLSLPILVILLGILGTEDVGLLR